tara:strand:- start:10244 stop:14503 length:4260 start_codon:yes stop_codon:yes gene_type:complete
MTSKQSDPGVIDVRLLLDTMKAITALTNFEKKMVATTGVVEAEARKIKNAFNKLKAPTIAVPKVGPGAGAKGFTGADAQFIGPLFPKGENARLKDANTQLVNLKTNTRGASDAAKEYNQTLGGTTAGLLKIGLAIQAFRIAARVTGEATKAGAEYNLRLAEIATLTDEATFSSQAQRDIVEDVADAYGESLLKTAPALYDAISAGATNAAEANAVLDNSIKLSIGTVSTQQEAASLLIGVLNSYGDEVAGAAKVTDDFFAIVRQGKLYLNELDPSLGRITPLAKAAGVSFKELGASIVALTRSGSSASEAITKIRSIINATIKKQDDFDKAFQRIGQRFDSSTIKNLGFIETLQTLQRALNGNNDEMGKVIGRVEGLAGLLSLVDDDARLFTEAMDGMEGSLGAADQAMNELRSSSGRAFDELKNTIGNFFTGLGEEISGATVELARFLGILDSRSGTQESFDEVVRQAIAAKGAISDLEIASAKLNARLQDLGVIGAGSLSEIEKFALDLPGGLQLEIDLAEIPPSEQADYIASARAVAIEAGKAAGKAYAESRADEIRFAEQRDRTRVGDDFGGVSATEIAEQSVQAGAELAGAKAASAAVDEFALRFRLGVEEAFADGDLLSPIEVDPTRVSSVFQEAGAASAQAFASGLDPLRDLISVSLGEDGGFQVVSRGALEDAERVVQIGKELKTVSEALNEELRDGETVNNRRLEVAGRIRDQVRGESKELDILLNRDKDLLQLELRLAEVRGDTATAKGLQAQIDNLQEIDRLNQAILTFQKDFATAGEESAETEAEIARRAAELEAQSKLVLETVNARKAATAGLVAQERDLAALSGQSARVDAFADAAKLQVQLTGSLEDQLTAIEANRRVAVVALKERIAKNSELREELQELLHLINAVADASSRDAESAALRNQARLQDELNDITAETLSLLGREREAAELLSEAKIQSRIEEAKAVQAGLAEGSDQVAIVEEQIAALQRLLAVQQDVNASGLELEAQRASSIAKIFGLQAQVTLSLEDQIAAIDANAAAEVASLNAKIQGNADLKEEYQALIPLTQALADAQVNDLINQQIEREVDLREELGEINADLLSILGKERQATLALNVAKTEAAIAERERLLLNAGLSEEEVRLLYEQIEVLRKIKEQQQAIADASFGEALVFGYEQAIDAVEDWAEAGERAGQGLALITRQLVNDLANNQFSWEALGQTAIKVIGNIIAELLTLIAIQKLAGVFNLGGGGGDGPIGPPQADGSFARGGIMQGKMLGRGNLPINAYASGGVANSPQFAIFGEGDGAEAFVPLPDGKNIPVKLNITGLAEMQKLTMDLINRVEMAHSSTATQTPVGNGMVYNTTTEISMPITVDARGAQDPAQVEASVDRAIDKAMPRIADTLGGSLLRGRSSKLVRGVRQAQQRGRNR